MGQDKALLVLDGRPLVLHHIDAFAPWCQQTLVVLGAHAEKISACLPPSVQTVHNPEWATTGPAESLLLALAHTDAVHAWVTPVDTPPAPSEVLSALAATQAPCVPTHQGLPGHPVRLDLKATRAALPGMTLRDVLATSRTVEVAWPGTLLNLNTPSEWATWCTTRTG